MNKFGFATVAASAFAAAFIGLAAPAQAAPSGPGNAQDTIEQLREDGFHVVVKRQGPTPLAEATVVGVSPSSALSGPKRDDDSAPNIPRTVYVNVK